MVIGIQDPLNPLTERVLRIPIEKELVRDDGAGWDPSSKAHGRKQLVTVVVLNDLTHSLDCEGVLVVHGWVPVVEALGIVRISVRGRKVNGNCEMELNPTLNVVKEGLFLFNTEPLKVENSGIVVRLLLGLLGRIDEGEAGLLLFGS
jgi:hypothetical protein